MESKQQEKGMKKRREGSEGSDLKYGGRGMMEGREGREREGKQRDEKGKQQKSRGKVEEGGGDNRGEGEKVGVRNKREEL